MFCPNCGKPNSEADRFCMYCGAELIDNQNFGDIPPAQQARELALAFWKKAKAFCKGHKKAVAGAAAALVVIVGCLFTWDALFSPKSVAVTYFKAVMNGDSSAAYSCLDIVESPFTGQDAFDTYWKNAYPRRDLYNYSVSETSSTSDKKDQIEHTFDFRYYLRGDSTPYTMTVTVVEGQAPASYKVLPGFVVTDYTITVPRGVSVTFGGQPLSNPIQGNINDTYTLPAVFSMPYDLELSGEMYEPFQETVYPISGELYTCSGLTFSQQTADALFATACTQFDQMIASILAYGDFPGDIALNEGSNVPETYSQMRSHMVNPEEGTGYYSINITDHLNRSEVQMVSGVPTYTCAIDLPYNYTRLRKSWTGEISADDGTSETYAELSYVYVGGQWLLEAMYVSGF